MFKFLTLLLLFPALVFSQATINISGKVTDKTTGLPLQGASVFAQNTTFGEATRNDGTFDIKLPNGGYDLVVTFTGYENFVTRINGANNGNNLIVELKPREKQLEEVSIVFSNEVKDGWQKYGSFFTDNFIGKTEFGNQTEIKNPEVLKFFFSKKRNRLKVTADQPLILENKALGYNIKYAIDSFTYEYNTNANTFVGYPLFTEMQGTPDQKAIWKQNRMKAYNGSILHFMRSLYNRSLGDEGFEVQFIVSTNGVDRSVQLKDQYGALNYSKSDSDQLVDFMPNQPVMAIIYNRAKPEKGYLIFDPNAKKDYQVSTLTIADGASIDIEANGYYFEQADMIINGYWGYQKVGNMLPYDFVPIK